MYPAVKDQAKKGELRACSFELEVHCGSSCFSGWEIELEQRRIKK